jgi:aldehyde dehydrogenase (NAD+)
VGIIFSFLLSFILKTAQGSNDQKMYDMQSSISDKLETLRSFYGSGITKPYAFRKQQLLKLKAALQRHEKEISDALFQDLRKSREESYATETGLVIAEINTMLKNLSRWMEPETVGSGLANFPSENRIYRDPLGVVLLIGP